MVHYTCNLYEVEDIFMPITQTMLPNQCYFYTVDPQKFFRLFIKRQFIYISGLFLFIFLALLALGLIQPKALQILWSVLIGYLLAGGFIYLSSKKKDSFLSKKITSKYSACTGDYKIEVHNNLIILTNLTYNYQQEIHFLNESALSFRDSNLFFFLTRQSEGIEKRHSFPICQIITGEDHKEYPLYVMIKKLQNQK